MSDDERFGRDRGWVTNDPSDAKVAAVLGRFEGYIEALQDDSRDRKRQVELMQEGISQQREAMAKMNSTIEEIRRDIRATSELDKRVRAVEQSQMDVSRQVSDIGIASKRNTEFRESIVNKLAAIGLVSAVSGAGIAVTAIKLFTGAH